MSKKIPSKDEALEALDFIVNVLKEHEKDLDRLINELGSVTEKMGDAGVVNAKVEKVEERLSTLQNEITNLITYLSAPRETPLAPLPESLPVSEKRETITVREERGPPLILRCKQWEDFQAVATGAQTLSFTFREDDKTFQADAMKDNQIMTYSGQLPKYNLLLKAWLANQLGVSEKRTMEGILAIG